MADVIRNALSPDLRRSQATLTVFLLVCMALWTLYPNSVAADNSGQYDRDNALQISQAAIGNLLGEGNFTTADGRSLSLAEFRGKPLLVSMIFTSCHHICPTTTKHIQQAATAAAEVLGNDSFNIISVGFDTGHDTPEAMVAFAKQQSIDSDNWQFLSASAETVAALSNDLGFQFFPSPRGFDHLNQLSVIDREGKVYSQVYGVSFPLPALVEPLKQLVFNRPKSAGHLLSGIADKIRLFCTVYNPASGRYEIDNSLFFQAAAGFLVVASIAIYLIREARRARSL